jgi:hypothetical protein
MRCLANFFTAMMLVLVLWTGTAVHAAERLECIEVGSEIAVTHEGHKNQPPASTDKSITHHHTSCGGHSISPPLGVANPQTIIPERPFLDRGPAAGVPGREPENQLRPPIA